MVQDDKCLKERRWCFSLSTIVFLWFGKPYFFFLKTEFSNICQILQSVFLRWGRGSPIKMENTVDDDCLKERKWWGFFLIKKNIICKKKVVLLPLLHCHLHHWSRQRSHCQIFQLSLPQKGKRWNRSIRYFLLAAKEWIWEKAWWAGEQ